MPRINMSKVVEELEHDFRRALVATLEDVLPSAGRSVDEHDLRRAFSRAVGHKFDTWKSVSDAAVETD